MDFRKGRLVMDIIRKRQLEARIALAMEDLANNNSGEVVKVDDGYDWIDNNGEIIVSMRYENN